MTIDHSHALDTPSTLVEPGSSGLGRHHAASPWQSWPAVPTAEGLTENDGLTESDVERFQADDVRGRDTTRRALLAAELSVAVLTVVVASSLAPLADVLLFSVALLVARVASGAVRPRLHLSVVDDLGTDAVTTVGALGATLALLTLTSAAIEPAGLVLVAVVATVLGLGVRTAALALLRRRRRATTGRNTLIIGAGAEGRHIAEGLLQRPELGLKPVGFLDIDSVDSLPIAPALPLLGHQVDRLADLVVAYDIATVIATYVDDEESLVDVMLTSTCLDTEIFVVPRLYELAADDKKTEWVAGIPLVRHSSGVTTRLSWRVKRLVDVLVSASLLAFLAPVLIAAAIGVMVEGGRPIFFRQHRTGVDGGTFELLKFRSMRPASELEQQTTWNIADDPRVGPVGRFLRRSSIDELPQLFNILRGEMSLVGPRPERPVFVQQFSAEHSRYWARHRLPVGLTGWAQVNGLRGDTSIAERARFDNYYIANWSLGLDLKILLLTVREVVRGSGS